MKIRNIKLANAQNTNEHRNKSKSTLQPEKIQSHINRGVALQIPQLSQCCCSGESEGRKEGNRGNAQTREEVSRADKCVHKTRSLTPVKLIPTSLFVTSSLVHFSFSKKKYEQKLKRNEEHKQEEEWCDIWRGEEKREGGGGEEGRRRGREGIRKEDKGGRGGRKVGFKEDWHGNKETTLLIAREVTAGAPRRAIKDPRWESLTRPSSACHNLNGFS